MFQMFMVLVIMFCMVFTGLWLFVELIKTIIKPYKKKSIDTEVVEEYKSFKKDLDKMLK